jgi:hypothetical protein
MGRQADALLRRIDVLQDRIDEAEARGWNKELWEAEMQGLLYAKRYQDEVMALSEQERQMRDDLKDMAKGWDAKMPKEAKDAYSQQKAAIEESIRMKRMERADAMRALAAAIGSDVHESAERLKAFRDKERERVENIHHMANSDMQGRRLSENAVSSKWTNNGAWRLVSAPLGTFEQMMRMFGSKSVDGRGYLFNHYVEGWQRCRDKEWIETQKSEAIMDAKASEILGRNKRWSDMYDLSQKKAGTCRWFDGDGMKEHDVTQGNLMYVYMVNKMEDGRVKLRRMGITEENMAEIEGRLDSRLKAVADWLQEEYLPDLRQKYNETHVRMFGAPMAAIDSYFPLRILSGSRMQNIEINEAKGPDGQAMPKTMTGAIIKRVYNNNSVDIMGSDAVSVALEHVREMETWNAFAEYRRDLGTLLSYKSFRNKVRNMRSVYGSGDKLWKQFWNLSLLVGGAYEPKISEADTALVKLTKQATGACIALRINTAIKQLLSMPAFASETSAIEFGKSILRPKGDWVWASVDGRGVWVAMRCCADGKMIGICRRL